MDYSSSQTNVINQIMFHVERLLFFITKKNDVYKIGCTEPVRESWRYPDPESYNKYEFLLRKTIDHPKSK